MSDLDDIFDGLEDEILDAIEEGVKELTNKGELTAKGLCSVDAGDLRESIHSSTNITPKDNISGTVYTNSDHAIYVEMGTGPVGQKSNPSDKYPGPVTYKSSGWWIPVGNGTNEIPLSAVKKYHFFTITTKDGKMFAFTRGQPARPFMYPAAVEMEKQAESVVGKKIEVMLK